MSFYETLPSTVPGYRDATVSQVAAVLAAPSPPRVIDVREDEEWSGELGHIAEAEHAPLATIASYVASAPKDATLILICRSGNRSGKAAALLASLGFTRLVNMTGGMLAWNASALPVAR